MAEEFTLNVSLLTPASDLVLGVDGVNFDLIFGRGGNDVFYSYDPIADANAKLNIDFLFGDLFDNSPEEFAVILQIAGDPNNGIPGNPFAILNANIPSVGKDRFVLGDEFQPYYTSFNPLSLLTDNLFGFNEFAVIYDFDRTQDKIQLNGSRKDYALVKVAGLPVNTGGFSGQFSGYALFSLQTGLPDLVSLIVQKPEVELSLKGDYFQFVGTKPKNKPAQNKIGQFGTNGIDIGYGVATDANGNLYVIGSTTGSLNGPNQGSSDVWVTKYDRNGNQVLALQLGTATGDSVFNIVTDKNGNFYLAGSTGGSLVAPKQSSGGSDAWVAKFSSNGTLLWGKQIGQAVTGGFSTSGFGLKVDDQGNVYLSGLAIKENVKRILDFAVEDDSWVIKFDSNGNQQWYTQIKDPQQPPGSPLAITPFFDENYDLAIDKNGNTYLSGWTQGLVKESDPVRDLLKYDAWLSKVDPSGNIKWTQQFGSRDQGLDFAWSVATDSQGNIYVSGWTTGTIGTQSFGSYDVWLTKFTPSGNQVWAKQIGTNGDDGAFLADMVIDANDNIFISGYTNADLGNGDADKSYNAWVGRFDTNGNNLWIQKIGIKDKADYATRLAVNNQGQVIVTGFTEGFLGNANNFQAQGAAVDAWVAQLAVKDGKLQNFIGNTGNVISISNPGSIPTINYDRLVTADKLPNGDNVINTPGNLVDYGQILSNLAPAFDPRLQSSVPTALRTSGIVNDTMINRTTKVDYKGTDRNDVYFGGSADDKLEGNKGDDVLYGRGGNDEIKGDEGDDILYGGDGNDVIEGGDGDDVIYGGNGADVLKGGNQNDLFVIENATDAEFDIFDGGGHDLTLNPNGDTIVNESYNANGQILNVVLNQFRDSWDIETFNGNGSAILGNANNNILDFRKTTLLNVAFVDGGAGDDDMKGSLGKDDLRGGQGNDKIEGNDGNDALDGGVGNDVLKGDRGNDTLIGGFDNDELEGGDGADILIGVDPNSPIAGRGEIDKLKGGNQADVFVLGGVTKAYYVGQGKLDYALIDDFRLEQGDKIQLARFTLGSTQPINYSLQTDIGGLPNGTGILANGDLIGIVKDVKGLSLSNTSVFTYV